MAKKVKYISNAPLEVGDKVICVNMDDPYSPISPGTMGSVNNVSEVQGDTIYYISWINGSKLALIDGVDSWKKITQVDEDDSLNENKIILVRTKKDILNKNF